VFLKWAARMIVRPVLGASSLGLGLACLLAALLAGAATGAQTGSGGGQAPQQPVSATLEQCVTASTQAGRSTTFTGQMETLPGVHRMAMLIVVQERPAGSAVSHAQRAPGLGTWQRSEVGVKIYKNVGRSRTCRPPRPGGHPVPLDRCSGACHRRARRTRCAGSLLRAPGSSAGFGGR
jgi:hypothetical protein